MADRSIPNKLIDEINEEIKLSSKPWRTSLQYICESISNNLAHDRGYRKRAQAKANKGGTTPNTD